MATSCSTSRIWVFLTFGFLLTTLAGIGYIIWREVWLKRNTEQMVVSRYPTLFRTVEQQKAFEFRYFNLTTKYTPVKAKVRDYETCTVNCYNSSGPTFGQQVSGPVQYHACCQSQVSFQDNGYLLNMFGQQKKIAQFDGNKQFFKYETCSHVVTFMYGQCSQHMEFVTAVTDDETLPDHHGDKYAVEWVQVPGCCKCLNVGSSNGFQK